MSKPVEIGTGLLFGAAGSLANDWSIALFNVPIHVVLMALAGAVLSYGFGDAALTRGFKLYFSMLAYAFISAVAVAILPGVFGWEWSNSRLEGPLAGAFAAAGRFVIPALLKAFPAMATELMHKWFGIGEYKRQLSKQEKADVIEKDEGRVALVAAQRPKGRKSDAK